MQTIGRKAGHDNCKDHQRSALSLKRSVSENTVGRALVYMKKLALLTALLACISCSDPVDPLESVSIIPLKPAYAAGGFEVEIRVVNNSREPVFFLQYPNELQYRASDGWRSIAVGGCDNAHERWLKLEPRDSTTCTLPTAINYPTASYRLLVGIRTDTLIDRGMWQSLEFRLIGSQTE